MGYDTNVEHMVPNGKRCEYELKIIAPGYLCFNLFHSIPTEGIYLNGKVYKSKANSFC